MTHPTDNRCEHAESDLIAEARNGDQGAMAELFRRHYSYSVSVARRLLPLQEEFLDAVQSAYLSAFRNFRSFRAEASFKTWISRIVLNQCLTHLREPRRHWTVLSLDEADGGGARQTVPSDSPTPEDLALRAELERAIADAAAELPRRLNDVFSRCSFSGLSIEATAEALGLTVPAAKTRLFRARSLVRQKVQATFPGVLTPAPSKIV